jgi:radical SAM superfamily enzyme YgiQ (UPF0313 family)
MKVAFILPGIGKKKNKKYIPYFLNEPLVIAVLKKLTPDIVDTEFYDDRIEAINYETNAEIIAITVETHTAKRAYAIADKFRAKGKIVVMGGYHVTIATEDARPYTDILVKGNAETVWEKILEDIGNKNFKEEYLGQINFYNGVPDRSIYANNMRQYGSFRDVEFGRGCHYCCEHCSVDCFYNGYIHREVRDILQEIASLENSSNTRKNYCFIDESMFSDKEFAKEVLTEITKLQINWYTYIKFDIDWDDELLLLVAGSGCLYLNLIFDTTGEHSITMEERDKMVTRMHNAGINIQAIIQFGFDSDTEDTLESCYEFSLKHQFFMLSFSYLIPYPGTETYAKLDKAGRLIYDCWWLNSSYLYGDVPFNPKLISKEKLSVLCQEYTKRFSEKALVKSRYKAMKVRIGGRNNPFPYLAYAILNMRKRKGKQYNIVYDTPLGENLDDD